MIRRTLALAACLSVATLAAPALAQMPQPLPPEVLADAPDEAKAAFLKANIVARGPVTGGLSFHFPADFYENRLFLLGESHGVAAPQVLDLELLTHLNARIGLTRYLLEADPVQADTLNRYLESGDETLLARVFDHWTATGAQWGNTAFEAKVRGVRALNQTLAEDRRIRFIGVDAVQDWDLVKDWIVRRGGAIDDAEWAAAEARSPLALAAIEAMPTPPDALTARLVDLLRRTAAGTDRETAIFDTYAWAVRSGELGDTPAYGLWGVYHVMQGPVNDTRPFAARVVKSDLPVRDGVVTLVVLSLDSAVQIPVPLPTGLQRMRLTDFNIDGPFVKVQGSATLRAASEPNEIVLFNPGAEGSPVEAGDFMSIRTSVGQDFVLDPNRPAASYAQYMGVFRDSDWAAPRP